MALDLGALVGRIELDAGGFETGLDDALGMFDGFGGKLGLAAGAVGAAAGVALATGFMAMDLEAGNDKIAASLDLIPAEAERVGAVAADVFSGGFGSGMDEVNTAIENVVAQIGDLGSVTDAELGDATEDALNLATVMESDVARVAQVAGQAVKEDMAGDIDEAFDIIAAASARTMPNLRDDLLDAADEYAPFFQSLGMDGERAFGLLAKASEKGMYGIDKLGDALKEFTLLSTDMSEKTTGAYESMGLDANKMADDLLQGGDKAAKAFDQIIAGLQDIEDPSDQAAAAIALFGTPIEDLSLTEIPEFLDSMTAAGSSLGDVEGAADKAGTTLHDNASTKFAAFGRSLQMWFVDMIGGKVLPLLSDFAAFLSTNVKPTLDSIVGWITTTAIPAFQAFGQWVGENRTPIMIVVGAITLFFLPAIAKAIAQTVVWGATSTAAGAKAVAAWIASSAKAAWGAIVQTAAMWKTIGGWTAMAGAAIVNGVVIAAQWIAMQAKAAWAVMMQLPHFAVLIGQWIAAGAVAVGQTAVIIGAWVAQKAAALLNIGITVAATVGGWIAMAASAIAGALVMAAAWILAMGPVGWVIAGIVALVALIVIFWDEIVAVTTAVFTAVWEFIKQAFDFVMGVIDFCIAWVKENWPLLLAILTGPFGLAVYFVVKFKDDIIRLAGEAVQWVTDRFLDLVAFFKGLPVKIARVAATLWDGIKDSFRGALNWLIDAWNGFELKIGGGSILGVDIPEIVLGTPNIPRLKDGGTALDDGAAIVGDGGQPELLHMPRAATVENLEHAASRQRIDALERRIDEGGGRGGVNINGDLHLHGVATGQTDEDILRSLRWAGAMA